jgi:hypothetical protein
VTGHGASVTEAEVDVTMTVNVEKMCALYFANERRKGTSPFRHPVHGHTAQQRFAGSFEQCFGLGPLLHKALLLALHEGC